MFFSFATVRASDVNMSDMSIEDSDIDSNLQIGNDILINEDNSGLSVISDNAQSLNESGKNQTQLSSKTNEIYYQGYYSLTLTDMNSNTPLAKKSVIF